MTGSDARLLVAALGIDNLGSGMFLPLVLVYVTHEVGVPLGLAGALVSAGALIGLLVPLVAGRFVDALGPRNIIIAAQLTQLVGMLAYLIAQGPAMVFVAAALTICGSQLFYSALFTLVGEIAPAEPKDHFFAGVDMVRSACFGIGALIAGVLFAIGGQGALVVIVVMNAASFLIGAAIGLFMTKGRRRDRRRTPGRPEESAHTIDTPAHATSVWLNGPFLLLTLSATMVTFASDFFLVGMSVFALNRLGTPGWVPGISIATLTVISSIAMAWMVRRTRSLARTTVIALGTAVITVWAITCMLTLAVPKAWAPTWLIGATVVLAVGQLLIGTRPNALAESIAPIGAKGRYLSFFQFGFSLAGVLAPLLVGVLAVSALLPWIIVAVIAMTGGALILALGPHLPTKAVHPTRRSSDVRHDQVAGTAAD